MVDHTDTLSRVIGLVRTRQAVTRPDLARATDLGRTVIMQRVDEALAAGILREEDAVVSTGGRPSKVLGIRADSGTMLAAVFGASRAHIALTDLAGRIIASEFIVTDISQGPERELSILLSAAERLLEDQQPPPLWGATIGLPGPVDFPRGRAISPPIMPGWHDFPVRERLQSILGVPVWVDNDVNLMTVGAWKETRDAASDDVLLLKVGTGVGAGIISRGQLHRGAQGAAGDIGHMTAVEHSNVQCRCGRFGCLEAYASGWALARDGLESAVDGTSPYLGEVFSRQGSVRMEDVIDAAKAGDRVSRELVLRSATMVGTKLADLLSMFNPATVFVAGSIARMGDMFIDTIRAAALRRSFPLATDQLLITRVSLGHREGALGAAWLGLDEIFSPPMLSRWLGNGSPRGITVADGAPPLSLAAREQALTFPGEVTPLYSPVPADTRAAIRLKEHA